MNEDTSVWSELELPQVAMKVTDAGKVSRQDLAKAILEHPGIVLATTHPSKKVDNANAYQNIVDTAGGKAAKRSSYGNAPGGEVWLDVSLLMGILTLAETYSFGVTEICGGEHSPNSRHYAGVGFDVNEINDKHVGSAHPDQKAFRKLCAKLGATEVLGPGDKLHSTHIHAAWPRPETIKEAKAGNGQLLVADAAAAKVPLTFNDFALRPMSLDFVRVQPEDMAGEDDILRALAAQEDLELPMERLIEMRNSRFPNSRPRFWAIADFDLHSAKPRMFVFDVVNKSVSSYLCAHGSGSEGSKDDGYAEVFSNKSGSHASSLGVYRCAETYESKKNGYSLRLDGLEKTNNKARPRAIVIHGADYVSEAFAKKNGRIGRSQGCPALDNEHASTVINQLKLGSLFIVWKTP